MLRGTMAATATVPLLEARGSYGATAAPTRLVVFLMPNGTRNALFWPTGSGSTFTMNTMTQALDPYKGKLTFLKGIKLNPALQMGELGQTLGSEHARGTGGLLTGRPLKAGTQFKSFGNTTSGWGSGQSIDQYLAQKLAPPTKFKSLQLGVHVRDAEVRARISYSGADQPIPPREDPKDVFQALFAAGATDRLAKQRKSVFDASNAETERIKKLVGAQDRLKLDAHLAAMRDVETRLVKLNDTSGTTQVCAAKPALVDVDLKADDQYQKAGQLQMDLAVAALACDLTRILTFQWSYSESEHLFSFLNVTGNHHAISHDFSSSGANYDAYNKIGKWYMDQVAYFLKKMDSYNEGTGTLLDNSLVLFATEIGESTQHDLKLMPYFLGGSAGGKLKTGRVVDYGTTPKDNNQLLVSLGQLMGATDLTSFGDASGAAGPLPNLT